MLALVGDVHPVEIVRERRSNFFIAIVNVWAKSFCRAVCVRCRASPKRTQIENRSIAMT